MTRKKASEAKHVDWFSTIWDLAVETLNVNPDDTFALYIETH